MTVSILSVDDEPDVAELFRQHFRREVTQGSTRCTSWPRRGGAADAGRRHPAAADCHPVRHQHAGMDGLSLLREVKKVRPEIPVMMVTAYGDDERRRRATELGAAEFLTKPVDFDSLRVRLRLLSIAAD